MKKIGTLLLLLITFAACVNTENQFILTQTFSDAQHDGKTIYLYNLNSTVLDSMVVHNRTATLKGNIDKPIVICTVGDEEDLNPIESAIFVLEPGVIQIEADYAVGTPLNEINKTLNQKMKAVEQLDFNARIPAYNNLFETYYNENKDNQLGILALDYLWMFHLNTDEIFDGKQLLTMINGLDISLQADTALVSLKENILSYINSHVGGKFPDITFDDQTSLSSYIDNGSPSLLAIAIAPKSTHPTWPFLEHANTKFSKKGLRVLTVVISENRLQDLESVLAVVKPSYPIKKAFTNSLSLFEKLQLDFTTAYFLLSPDGIILLRSTDENYILQSLDSVL